MMLANAMIPEAYDHAGRLAGVITVIGFATSVLVIVLERSDAASGNPTKLRRTVSQNLRENA